MQRISTKLLVVLWLIAFAVVVFQDAVDAGLVR
ncbi:MAG: hypothetical protein RLZZ217_1923 [Planctomycetota bacterium]|jgi:hypothetical protein